ncbi:MAG TPA: glycosyltransferase [Pyrinomonadaceae bacterium]|nr:glycosyltransferase [Chloracidobacterium sp.]HRJ89263.1 glycosyltransferase [Pyrinomonadaceae bacterium]HRK52198.1 glycosyltransferase [Pyrinomonadaceae bacterium]
MTEAPKKVDENDYPLVSVIIPAYLVADYIEETLNSVLAQTYTNLEIVVINDGSPDTERLEAILAPYQNRINYVAKRNGGTASARNAGIRAANGEFLAFLDGDDVWFPEYLSTQVQEIQTRNCDVIYCDALLFGELVGPKETFMTRNPSIGAVTSETLLEWKCNLITSGTVARRNLVTGAGLFDESLPKIGFEDFDLWLRLVRAGAVIEYHRKPLLKYRLRADSLSGSSVQRAERTMVLWDHLMRKFSFNDSELAVIARQHEKDRILLETERAKWFLVNEDFEGAQRHLDDILVTSPSIKLKIIDHLLKISPRLLRATFRCLRRREFDFILSASR